MGGPEPLAEGSGGVGGAEALDRISVEGLPCRLRHDGLQGGLVGVGGGADAHLLEFVHHVHPFSPFRSPGPLHPAAKLLQSGGRPPGEVGGGFGGGGVRAQGPAAAGGDVDLRWWWGWRCLGEREWRWRGLGVEDGYGRRGEREGEVDMGLRWRAWWRLGEREWGRWGLGQVDGYGWRGVREARRGLWGEGEVDMGRRWRAWRRQGERERWWRGLGVGVVHGREGEGEVDMGRRRHSWWRPGERGRRERGLGGSWWRLGELQRREWVVEARRRCGKCGRRGQVCHAGGERQRRRLRDRASSLESCQSGGVGGPWGASRGAAWYWGGGPPSSMDPPRRDVVAAAAACIGRVTVPGGVGPRGRLRRGRGGRGDTVPGTGGWLVRGGWPLVVGGVCGWSARWLPSHLLVLFLHGGLWPGGVGGSAVVVVGLVSVVVVVGPLMVVALVVVGLVLRVWPLDPLWVFWSPLWGWVVGHRAQHLGLYYVVGRGGGSGAVLDGDGSRGVPRPWVGFAGGGGGLWGMDDGALGDGDVDEGLDGVVSGGRLCRGGGCWWEGGVHCGGRGVLAWVRAWVRAVSVVVLCVLPWAPVWVSGRV